MNLKSRKGLVQIYTGNGKGKTTAALGLALRAIGAGLKVCICQFVKGKVYSEIKALEKLKNINVFHCGRSCFIKGRPDPRDALLARRGLARVRRVIMSGRCDVVIMDELTIVLKLGLVDVGEIIDILRNRPRSVEIIITGRYCTPALFKHADLITEMREIKHPYKRGILARRGIEY